MEDKPTKQVIVVRTIYPHPNGGTFKLRAGKMIAQAAHASIAFLTRRMSGIDDNIMHGVLTDAEVSWLNSSFAKVTLQVESEKELIDIYEKAQEQGLEVHLITDAGRTEFDGVPTRTCLAIGPDYSDKIDKITGELKLY